MALWKPSSIRPYLIFFLLLLAGSAIIYRLYCLQLKEGEYYHVLALGQHVSFGQTENQRGQILLNKQNRTLASLKKIHLLYIFPNKIPAAQLAQKTKELSAALGLAEEDLISQFRENKIIKKQVSPKTAEKIKAIAGTGIHLNQSAVRFYPENNLASHILGFCNQEGQGQYGLEGFYNEILSGQPTDSQKVKSPFGYLTFSLNEESIRADENSASLVLGIDYNIQYLAEKLLKKAVEDWQITTGQIIVANPQTGQILALASWPDFDPNNFSQEQDLTTFLNPTVQKLFEPGSILKPIVMAAAFEERLLTPETTYQDKGMVEVGGPAIYNFEKRVWGEQTMTQVLERSINTGAVFVQQALGEELFLQYLDKFGFFEKTEIDLQGEVISKNEPLKRGYQRDLATASFGQGIEITPIQLIKAFSALANNGKLIKPHLAEKIIQTDIETILEPVVENKVISKNVSIELTSMLVSVVENGSAQSAKIPGYYIAGKTGTAQIPKKKGGYQEEGSIQSFIGYFPALNPQYLILVKLDNPVGSRMAGLSTGPIFRDLAKYIIDLKQIPPDYTPLSKH